MNRLNTKVDEARRAMTANGELPRGLVPNRETIETDQFFGDIYFNNDREKPECVAKVVVRTAEDKGRVEMVRAATKDDLMAELLRQVGESKTQEEELQAPPRPTVHMPLANYSSPEQMLEDVIQSAAARQWLVTPVGQQYSRLERVCGNTRVFEIFKRSMEELGYWKDSAMWTMPNLNHAFIVRFDRGDYKYFENKADRRDSKAEEEARADAAASAPEFQYDAKSPYLYRNADSNTHSEEVKTDKALSLSELRRKAYAQRFANK